MYAQCSPTCAPADNPYHSDGFKACLGWNNPVTVWRQNTSIPTNTGTGGATGGSGTGGAAGTGGATGTGGSSGTKTPPPPPPKHGLKIIT